ncbi:hypothetical protein E2320_022306 [Naja naja]|nr:hypothetical protein E2320_022306 [Naja naja]
MGQDLAPINRGLDWKTSPWPLTPKEQWFRCNTAMHLLFRCHG